MNVVKCKNGHFYDADTYNVCPHCGAPMGNPAPAAKQQPGAKPEKKSLFSRLKSKQEKEAPAPSPAPRPVPQPAPQPVPQPVSQPAPRQDSRDAWNSNTVYDPDAQRTRTQGKTYSLWNHTQDGQPAPQPVPQPAPQPVPQPIPQPIPQPVPRPAPQPEADSLQNIVQRASANSEGKTMSYFNTVMDASAQREAEPIEPVVGWLVCTAGPHLGASFCLHAGKNSLGRNEDNDLVLDRDNQVSRSRHATVIYEPKHREFYLQPGDSSGLVYYNSEYIAEVRKMESRGVVELGETELLFVPLCGPDFTWEDKLKKE